MIVSRESTGVMSRAYTVLRLGDCFYKAVLVAHRLPIELAAREITSVSKQVVLALHTASMD